MNKPLPLFAEVGGCEFTEVDRGLSQLKTAKRWCHNGFPRFETVVEGDNRGRERERGLPPSSTVVRVCE